MDKPICNNCGACCFYILEGKMKKCKNLIITKDNTTQCRIYKTRLGAIIDRDSQGRPVRCGMRNSLPLNFPGCPYNRPEWKDAHPDFKRLLDNKLKLPLPEERQ